MKPFTRVKVIKGIEYLYEITPYYDPVQKKIRQKSKYLGKLVNDQPLKVRSQKKPLISIPEKVLSYGEYLPLLKIVEELKLNLLLSRTFTEK
jgi:transposase